MKLESSHWSLTIVPNERSYKILPTSFRTFQLQAFQHKTIRLLDVSNNAFQIGNSNFVYIIANKINEKRYNFGNSGFANTSRITIQNIIIFHSISLWVWLVWPIALHDHVCIFFKFEGWYWDTYLFLTEMTVITWQTPPSTSHSLNQNENFWISLVLNYNTCYVSWNLTYKQSKIQSVFTKLNS